MKYFFILLLFLIRLEAADVVKDKNLEWQDNREAKEEIWKMARGYCAQLRVDGKSDWRLPTPKELQSLGKSHDLKNKFVFLEEGVYWSSKIDKDDEFSAISVYSGNGFVSSSDKCDKYFVMCIRDIK